LERQLNLVGPRLSDSLVALVVSQESDSPWRPTHFVSRDLHLRGGASVDHHSIRRLPRLTFIQLLDGFSEGWVQVRILDPEAGEMVEGWLYGRYVRPFDVPWSPE